MFSFFFRPDAAYPITSRQFCFLSFGVCCKEFSFEFCVSGRLFMVSVGFDYEIQVVRFIHIFVLIYSSKLECVVKYVLCL